VVGWEWMRDDAGPARGQWKPDIASGSRDVKWDVTRFTHLCHLMASGSRTKPEVAVHLCNGTLKLTHDLGTATVKLTHDRSSACTCCTGHGLTFET
jgi:hypothetical protein